MQLPCPKPWQSSPVVAGRVRRSAAHASGMLLSGMALQCGARKAVVRRGRTTRWSRPTQLLVDADGVGGRHSGDSGGNQEVT